jgi:hypothetical protein
LLSSRLASEITEVAVREDSVGVRLMKIGSRSYPAQRVSAFSQRKQVGRRRSHLVSHQIKNPSLICFTALTFTLRRLQVLQASDFPATPTIFAQKHKPLRYTLAILVDRMAPSMIWHSCQLWYGHVDTRLCSRSCKLICRLARGLAGNASCNRNHLSNKPTWVSARRGPKVFHLPFCCGPTKHPKRGPSLDASYMGSVYNWIDYKAAKMDI